MKLAKKVVVSLFAISFIFAAACGGNTNSGGGSQEGQGAGASQEGQGAGASQEGQGPGGPKKGDKKKGKKEFELCSKEKRCPDGSICMKVDPNKSICAPTCQKDDECIDNGGRLCDELPKPLIVGDGYINKKVCAEICSDKHRCPEGYICKLDGSESRCVKNCQNDGECANTGRKCLDLPDTDILGSGYTDKKVCRNSCNENMRCPDGYICGATGEDKNKCIKNCTSDNECLAVGRTCKDLPDSDILGDGYTDKKVCSVCSKNIQCPQDFVCFTMYKIGNVCAPNCKTDADCELLMPNATCDNAPGTHFVNKNVNRHICTPPQ